MSFDTERLDIENRFKTQWGSTTPVCWGNVAFDPTGKPEWVRLSIITGMSEEASVGTPTQPFYRHRGLIVVGIFVPLNAGESRARVLAQQAGDIFKSQKFSNILCHAPYLTVVGESGSYFQVNVTTPYKRDEFS